MSDPVPTGLLNQSREIAQIRDELVRIDKELTASKAKNATLLEETSVFDSEVTRQCSRAAVSEQRLANLEEEARRRSDEKAKHKAAQAALVETLKRDVGLRREALGRAEAATAQHRDRFGGLEAELERLRGLLDAESDKISSMQIVTKERRDRAPSFAEEAERTLESELEAIAARRDFYLSEAANIRQQAVALEAEFVEQRQRRDELGRCLRQAVSEHGGDAARLRSLEAAVAERGGDVGGVLAAAHGLGGDTAGRPSRCDELRSELRASEEQHESMQASLERVREKDAQAATRLQSDLDAAREGLQRSLREAAHAHGAEVAKLEAEVQAERDRGSEEVLAEQLCAESMEQLREQRARVLDQTTSLHLDVQTNAGTYGHLCKELERLMSEVQASEDLYLVSHGRSSAAEQRKSDALIEGERGSAKVRTQIEDIWRGLRAVRPADEG